MTVTNRQGGYTTTLTELLRLAINRELTEFHVCLPGKIESYNPADGTATVKPTISRRFRGDANVIEYPVIPKVPIVQPRTAKARINFPIESGDLVLIVFSDRSLENWIQSAGDAPREAKDLRRHDLSDAFAILGGYPSLVPAPPKFPGALNIEIEPGTKIALTNGSVELLALFDTVLAQMDTILTNIQALTVSGVLTGGGVSGVPVNAALFLADQVAIADVKTKLALIKA